MTECERIKGKPIPDEIKRELRKEQLTKKYPNGFRRAKKTKDKHDHQRHTV